MKEIPTHNDPASVTVHPYHPDTELFRYTYATFYDRIQDSDTALGKLIEMLEMMMSWIIRLFSILEITEDLYRGRKGIRRREDYRFLW